MPCSTSTGKVNKQLPQIKKITFFFFFMNDLGVPGYSSFGTKQKIQEGKWGIKIKRHGLCTVLVGYCFRKKNQEVKKT